MSNETVNSRSLICPQCGGTMEVRYVGILRDKRLVCHYCRTEIDLPDDEIVAEVAPAVIPSPPYFQTVQTAKDNKLAAFSLIAGIAGLINFAPLLGSIVAIVTGYKALRRVREQPQFYTGEAMARVGIILGYAGLAITMLFCCLYGVMYLLAAWQANIYTP